MSTMRLYSPATIASLCILVSQTARAQIIIPDLFPFLNSAGISETHNTKGNGQIDTTGPFFSKPRH
jgi:hypothetical protein